MARRSLLCSQLLLATLAGCGSNNDQALIRELEKREQAIEAKQDVRAPAEYPTTWRGSRTQTLAPGIHAIGELYPSAAYIVETSAGPILFDTGVDENAWQLRASMVELGIVIEQTKYVFITHAHYDHVFGTNKIRQVSGAIVCAGQDDCETLRSANQAELFSLFPKVQFSRTPIPVDRELIDGDVIEVGDVTISVIGAPGHTPGSVCYLVEKDDKRILVTGDVIASLNMGPATYPISISSRYRGNAEDFLKTINQLLQLDPPDLLLCGHPQQSNKAQPLSLNSSQWKQLLQPAKDEIEELLVRHLRDGADFLDGDPKQIEPGLFYLGELDSTAIYALVDDSEVTIINAPGGRKLAGFLRKQFRALDLQPIEPGMVLLTSADQASYSGVASLKNAPRIIAHDSVVAVLRDAGVANVNSHREIKEHISHNIQAIPLSKHSQSLLAYSWTIGEKEILITPDIPRNIILVWTDRRTGKQTRSKLTPQYDQLSRKLERTSDFAVVYRESLDQLSNHAPDVWLPAVPRTGQNANLYGNEWTMLIDDNAKVAIEITNEIEF